jgi:hypothetical protein
MRQRRQQRKQERILHAAMGVELEKTRGRRSFHRGDVVNFHPQFKDFDAEDFLGEYLLKGWVPPQPVLARGMKITAFGSCFAANITRHLSAIGYDLSKDRDPDVYISRMGDGMVNTAAILGQFQWALENQKQAENLWHDQAAQGHGFDEDIRLRTRDIFLGTEFFIITLGLSEIWYDTLTGGTFWRAVPDEAFDPARHKFRVLSFAETKADIAEMHRLVRTHVPGAKILFTVSPIPLAATFRPVSCLTANAASKAIIRAALDEFLREHEGELNDSLFYFPSMELVMQGFTDPWESDMRHPEPYVLDTVMRVFEAAFCRNETTLEEAARILRMFRAKNLRSVSNRRVDTPEERALVSEAKTAKRASRQARREAIAHQEAVGSALNFAVKAQRKAKSAETEDAPE